VDRRSAGAALVIASVVATMLFAGMTTAGAAAAGNNLSSTERFQDMGFGLFIHWGPVAQTGQEISLSLKDNPSREYVKKYFNLYKTFNPTKFSPRRWARLASGAGMRYVVFTTKHHDGFCMYDSDYTEYDIMHTPYGEDITAQVAEAFRAEDIAIGWYYSPADWRYLYVNGQKDGFDNQDYWMKPSDYPGPYGTKGLSLLEYEKRQIRELLTNYGDIEIMWYDGPGKALARHTWELKPDVFIARARGAGIPTPEQKIPEPGKAPEGAWETCMTMGQQWAYKPDDNYKSARTLVHTLVKIRAMGGNLLLNVGPRPDGTLPDPQVERLEKLGRWMDVNRTAIHDVRAWKTPREGRTWFTAADDGTTVYAVMTQWPDGGSIALESFAGHEVKSVQLCGAPQDPEWEIAAKALKVNLPDEKPCRHAYTLEIQL